MASHLLLDLLVADGIDVGEGQVLQLAANLAHAKAVRHGRVDVEGLLRDLRLPLGRQVLQGAHVVQAVGQFDEHHADVIHHGQHHLAHVFRLRLLARGKVNLADLGDALDDVGHLLAEFLLELLGGDGGVFHRVVQQAGGDGGGVQLHLRQEDGDLKGMDEVGLAGGALLAGVVLQGELVGATDNLYVVAGMVGADEIQQLAELGDRENIGRNLLPQARHA